MSHGSLQSNSMHALSYIARKKNWKFDFYVSRIPKHIKNNPNGNYLGALQNNANIIVDSNFNINNYILYKNELFISEGGKDKRSEYGLKTLAREILHWCNNQNIPYQKLKIMLPSGTGTTSLYLQKNLPKNIKVITCACVGSSEYLMKQFSSLCNDNIEHPTILPANKKYHFGKLYKEFYNIYNSLKNDTKIEFDLLYDPLGWITLLENLKPYENDIILYIHQGGLKGNETMIERYERKYDI